MIENFSNDNFVAIDGNMSLVKSISSTLSAPSKVTCQITAVDTNDDGILDGYQLLDGTIITGVTYSGTGDDKYISQITLADGTVLTLDESGKILHDQDNNPINKTIKEYSFFVEQEYKNIKVNSNALIFRNSVMLKNLLIKELLV